MDQEERAYLHARASQELELAEKANRPEVVAAHCALADLYFERLRLAGSITKRPSGL